VVVGEPELSGPRGHFRGSRRVSGVVVDEPELRGPRGRFRGSRRVSGVVVREPELSGPRGRFRVFVVDVGERELRCLRGCFLDAAINGQLHFNVINHYDTSLVNSKWDQ